MFKWIIAQMTFFQFWTPPMLRNWGVGTPNGSLWTIPVELQFYLLLPALVILLTRIKVIYKVWVLTFFSILCNLYVSDLDLNSNYHILPKIIKLTLLPYLLYFNIGIIMNTGQRFRNSLKEKPYGGSLFLLYLHSFSKLNLITSQKVYQGL
jgi:peptidoglycan/LPS O-acetylase OafA/YrhL